MKRIFLAVLSGSLLVLGVPSAASAHHARHHAACASRHHHHARCAHARAHVLSFGPSASTPGSTTSAPTTPTSGEETAGTVTSYTAPTLTITLNDKKTEVTGKVTESTRIYCESTTPSSGEDGDDDGGEGGDSQAMAGQHDEAMTADFRSGDDSQGDDEGDDGGNVQPCATTALMPGTVVRAAELVLTNEGAVWEKVILVS